jgi:hypothetical protein
VIGEQHYFDVQSFGPNGTAAMYTQRDTDKKRKCAEIGIDYAGIPYWYDFLMTIEREILYVFFLFLFLFFFLLHLNVYIHILSESRAL